ncbi:putative peptide transporter ptr2 [Fulvia fulva]|uniref:Peptide transporter ptr2 n=1 Tax=Passalora fulva TaxID=5499 RepID=A0A9Q8UTL4_PASFU|nr:putative peptide transporter ptr2 [Fulvia fulva]KAK4614012.1 putative peptide transporter ptr2 [Fulvia fulva]UJO21912.1 putative peptide transporter ptr2 [Fulvia fulva]WPV20690.1 putative peptide transporter ptr2 [Fulvia fulva]WPV35273.1 putative peptide transporter ptr2 [Fulvia fulva]
MKLSLGDNDVAAIDAPIRSSERSPKDITENIISETRQYSEIPHVADRLTLPIVLVLVVGGLERAAYYAVSAPWQNYMQNDSESRSPPGALGLGQATATAISNAYLVLSSLTPVPFAIVADLWLGRYRTLVVGLSLVTLGCIVQLATSLVPLRLDAGLPGLLVSMILIALGTGGVRTTITPFLAEQSRERESCVVENADGTKQFIDSRLTLQLIYNVYYAVINFACLSMVPSTLLEKQSGFWASYTLATACTSLALAFLIGVSFRLVKVVPGQNILVPAAKVMNNAIRNGFVLDRAKSPYQLSQHGISPPYTDAFVDEVRNTMQTCRVLLSFAIFYLCANQMNNNLVSQAGQMQLSGIPNDMVPVFASVTCCVLAPILQALWSFLARHKIIFSAHFLIEWSFVMCAVAIALAAVTQHLIYTSPPCYDRPRTCGPDGRPNKISVWVQLPTYIIAALAETVGFVTASEYAYSHSPPNARSMIQAFSQLAAALGSLLGLATSPAARDPWLVVYYGALAGVMLAAAFVFWWFFRKVKANQGGGQHEQ